MGLFGKQKKQDDGEYFRASSGVLLSKAVCARCGVDLHMIDKESVVTVDGKQYCDVCGAYLIKKASAPAEPAAAPAVPRPETPAPAAPDAGAETMSDEEILNETFFGVSPVSGSRNNDICNRFIARGIGEYANGSFDARSLEELSFDEFCHVYSTVGWFVNNVAPGLKAEGIAYKRFLRTSLLARLSTFPVYTITAAVTALPYILPEGSMLLYTDRKIAEAQIAAAGMDWLCLCEIAPAAFKSRFCEFLCTGTALVKINGKTAVKLRDVCRPGPMSTFGNLCVGSCTRMVDFQQNRASMISKAKKEGRELTEEENRLLNRQSWGVSQSLLKDKLLVPVQTDNGALKAISIPTVFFPDGRKVMGLFTDQWAINGYFGKNVPCACFPCLVRDGYAQLKDDPACSGILINPGREEYLLTKEMLAQLFTE